MLGGWRSELFPNEIPANTSHDEQGEHPEASECAEHRSASGCQAAEGDDPCPDEQHPADGGGGARPILLENGWGQFGRLAVGLIAGAELPFVTG